MPPALRVALSLLVLIACLDNPRARHGASTRLRPFTPAAKARPLRAVCQTVPDRPNNLDEAGEALANRFLAKEVEP
jgi:hypothetical protein